MQQLTVDKILLNALQEDLGHGDVTTESCVPADAQIQGKFMAKEDGLVCGLSVVKRVFALLSPDIEVTHSVQEGGSVASGDVIASVCGNARAVLSGERVALNFLQRLSGIATQTQAAVQAIQGRRAKITDTRKTTPGLRILEKYAVRVGGGTNHRFNLADGVLIKDNHIVAAGGIENAVMAARKAIPHTLKIEVETSNLSEVAQAIDAHADIIMLDNMSLAQMREAVEFVNGRALIEASGNMWDRNLQEVADTGVDFISIGALTHRIRALDISLKFTLEQE